MVNRKHIFLIFMIALAISGCAFAFRFFGTSYAIDVGIHKDGFPTATFTSNVTSDAKNNYIKKALEASGTGREFYANFDVVSNFKTSDNRTPLYSFMKNLETPKTTEKFELNESNPTGITDEKILYILSHGYNVTNTTNTVFTTGTYGSVTDNNIKQYITQVALWLYIYENKASYSSNYCLDTGKGYTSCDFYNSSTKALMSSSDLRTYITNAANVSGYNYLNYIIKLVDSAKSYTGGETSKISPFTSASITYTINRDFTQLVTDTVTPTVDSNRTNYMYYAVEVSDPNSYGVYLTDNDGNRLSNYNVMNGSFKIVVPLKEDLESMDLSSIKITVYGYFVNYSSRGFRVTTSPTSLITHEKTQTFTDVLFGYTPYEVIGTSFNLYNFVKVSKIDVTNSSELPGATLKITKKDDETKVHTWVSTYEPHYLYLENGDYTLCETIAPEGFALNTECVDFTVDGGKIVAVTMENEPTVPIPDTGAFGIKTLYYIGIALIVIGASTVIIIQKKKINQN